ncbi:F-box-like domain-containing protein [Legionella brunensis]|uniref:F-box protein n=1 Tax=Legionella brunensis TaxID=29422 RepID=A0A0W0SDZ6_9GAMM|nr:F-box-like domain-containing protein [Legionella brunensis]KTC81361.1 F-box protein [Legionella brunensis]
MKLKNPVNIFSLPEELLVGTFSFFNAKTLGRVAQVCGLFNRIANDSCLDLDKTRQARLKNQLWGELMMAARHDDLATVKAILKRGIIDPAAQVLLSLNKTPLLAAIEGKAYKTARYLWENYDFDPQAKDYYKESPISTLEKQLRRTLEKKERTQIQSLLKEMKEGKEHHKCLVC